MFTPQSKPHWPDFIEFQGVTWTRKKGAYPTAYSNGEGCEVYHVPSCHRWHSRRKTGGTWEELDLYGGHPDPATAIKYVHRLTCK